jgi:hypothetical protein
MEAAEGLLLIVVAHGECHATIISLQHLVCSIKPLLLLRLRGSLFKNLGKKKGLKLERNLLSLGIPLKLTVLRV